METMPQSLLSSSGSSFSDEEKDGFSLLQIC